MKEQRTEMLEEQRDGTWENKQAGEEWDKGGEIHFHFPISRG